MNLKDHRKWLAYRDRSERTKQLGVLGLVPLRGKTIRSAYEKLVTFELEWLRGLQPCFEGLFR